MRTTSHPHKRENGADLSSAEEITALLASWSSGDASALEALTPLVYAELRRIAEGYLRLERAGHTLQPTALVHEAWMRLARPNQSNVATRTHFYALAARIMRRVLVDWARAAGADKRGSGHKPVPLSEHDLAREDETEAFLALEEALCLLGNINPRQARIVELKYFGGLTGAEIAGELDTSPATVSRELRTAEAWLAQAMTSSRRNGAD